MPITIHVHLKDLTLKKLCKLDLPKRVKSRLLNRIMRSARMAAKPLDWGETLDGGWGEQVEPAWGEQVSGKLIT